MAIKIIEKTNLTFGEVDDIRDALTMYQIAQHHNVVSLEDYFESKDNIFLCLEYHSEQTLEGYIAQYKNDIEEGRARDLGLKLA